METAWILYLCVFGGAFLAFQAFLGMGKQAAVQVRLVNDRLRRLDKADSTDEVLLKLRKSRGLTEAGDLKGLITALNKLVLQSGLPLGAKGIYWILAITPLFLGIGFFLFKGTPQWALGGVIAGLVIPVQLLRILVKRRRNKAVKQLPEALDVIIRALRAGYPVPVAMGLVAREMPDPIGTEFGITSDEISYGSGVSQAVQRMVERVGHDDFMLFAAIIRLQERTGGNLAELLTANAKTIRDRQKMRLKIKAASAEGRMSALILNAAPFGMFAIIKVMSPEFYGDVDHHPLVNYSLWGIVIWMGIGNLIMRRMINFKI